MYCAADYTKGTVPKTGFDHEIWQYGNEAPYQATVWLTMDKSARILELPYNKKAAEYISDEYRYHYLKKVAKKEQKEFVDTYIESARKVEKLTFSEPDEVIDAVYNQRNKASENIRDLLSDSLSACAGKDPGVLAAEMGYDAINATGHGETGSYTVALNRTKLIIYGGDDYAYKPK